MGDGQPDVYPLGRLAGYRSAALVPRSKTARKSAPASGSATPRGEQITNLRGGHWRLGFGGPPNTSVAE